METKLETSNAMENLTALLVGVLITGLVVLALWEQIMTGLVIVGLWLFWWVVVPLSVIGLVIGLVVLATHLYKLYLFTLNTKAENERLLALAEQARVTATGEQVFYHKNGYTEAWHLDPRWRHNGHYTEPMELELKTWAAFHSRNRKAAELEPVVTVEKPTLLALTGELDRILLIGGSGSGKTSYMQHFIAHKEGEVVVCDPHDDGRTWPTNARVVGGGLNYEDIEREARGFYEEYKKRYRERSAGRTEWPFLYMVLEEWYITRQKMEFGDELKELLTSLRKVNMGIMVISQSFRAESLGLRGNFDLKDSFEAMVQLKGNRKVGITADVVYPDGRSIVVEHPGPYLALPARSYSPAPTEEDRIVAMASPDLYVTNVAEQFYGEKSGDRVEYVREILDKRGAPYKKRKK